ncbi:uncharacterized protein [Medicago truncatula]|uniref:uncharacterized protein n=1 Tax=Medicago truncatula TaxID=3880 RepID=UPI00196760B5|nr:uncharacterized protein LOC112422678 [Medicago truncatula]
MPLWEIIDERWDERLHGPLHATGYFLNPEFHYSNGFRDDIEVKGGLHDCITRMVADSEERAKIEIQLDDFDKWANDMTHPVAVTTAGNEVPSVWWSAFGEGLPELQKFACRVLSLTCSSYGGDHNRSAFEMVHAKRRNSLWQNIYNDSLFVMANSKLAEDKARWFIELLQNLKDNGNSEGTPYLKSLHDVIADLYDEYGVGDEVQDRDKDEDQMEDSD